jgi:hypothetical protein
MRRMLVVAVAMVAALGWWVPPAGAGGGIALEPDRESYHPGEVVHMAADITKLDREWHGPYTVSLHSFGGTVPGAEEGFPVGRLVVTRLDDTTVRAEVTFVLPKLPDGMWQVSYCSADCNRSLGDLSTGFLLIGDPPPPPDLSAFATTLPLAPATTVPTTAAPVTTSTPVTSTEPAGATEAKEPAGAGEVVASGAVAAGVAGDDGASRWWVIGALAAAALLAAAVLLGRRRGGTPRRSITSSGSPDDDTSEGVDVVEVGLEPDRAPDETVGVGR